jgi:hypothetical protein
MLRCTKLNWSLYPDISEVEVSGDGSCWFHAISMAMFKPYQKEEDENGEYSRRDHVVGLRAELSRKLATINHRTGLTYYNSLSRGGLGDFSKNVPEYSLQNMQKQLLSDDWVDNVYNEYISEVLCIDLYVLNEDTKDVMIMGDDSEILYKTRNSVVLIYKPSCGHYNLVGIDQKDHVQTYFLPDNEFIKIVLGRMSLK